MDELVSIVRSSYFAFTSTSIVVTARFDGRPVSYPASDPFSEMPEMHVRCVLCGVHFGQRGRPLRDWKDSRRTSLKNWKDTMWLYEYRAVYNHGLGRGDPQLSGVGFGVYQEGSNAIKLPVGKDIRYDDPDYDGDDPALHEQIFGHGPSQAQLSRFHRACWGYVFYEGCWHLLKELRQPMEVDIRVLNDFFQSFPEQLDRSALNWGHDYGDLVRRNIDPRDLLPGEEDRLVRFEGTEPFSYDWKDVPFFEADPININAQILWDDSPAANTKGASQEPPSGTPTETDALYIHIPSDCFTALPAEILEFILFLLPSKDVLNLRIASRWFARLRLSESFWASRFSQESQEHKFRFDCIFELKEEGSKRKHNWRLLYHAVRKFQYDIGLKNRNRIWTLLQPLADALSCFSLTRLVPLNELSHLMPPHRGWIHVMDRSVLLRTMPFTAGSTNLYSVAVEIPPMLTGVYVSLYGFHGAEYVTGFRFVQDSDEDVSIGYNLRQNEVFLGFRTRPDSAIRGFRLATDMRGIRAIAILTASGVTGWAGHPERHLPIDVTARNRFSMLRCGFDASRIVTFSVPQVELAPSLRHTSFKERNKWLPSTPPDGLCFNEDAYLLGDEFEEFVEREEGIQHHLIFGGLHGIHLPKLTRIHVWAVRLWDSVRTTRILGIGFQYNTEVDGKDLHVLGFPGALAGDQRYSPFSITETPEQTIAIDGPGGERITGIGRFDVLTVREEMETVGFRIHTNRNRTLSFPDVASVESMENDYTRTRENSPRMEIQDGTTITGFYGCITRDHHSGTPYFGAPYLRNLGVISECI